MVIAIEPFPENVKDINQNVALNNLQNIEVVPVAVGGKRGEVELIAHSNGIVVTDKKVRVIKVPLESLDTICGDRVPDVIKIDVEGLELDVLFGAKQILASKPRLAIEVHPLYKQDRVNHCRQVFDLLGEHGYRISAQLGIDQPKSNPVEVTQPLRSWQNSMCSTCSPRHRDRSKATPLLPNQNRTLPQRLGWSMISPGMSSTSMVTGLAQ